MNAGEPLGMYVVSGVLFLLPCSLLGVAWRRLTMDGQESAKPSWRTHCISAALLVASSATLVSVVSIVSWLHSGGSPHGLGPPPGLWKLLGPVLKWTLIASVVLATLGKGKGRILVLGGSVSVVLVMAIVFVLDMD
jgi:hypothetical protein